MNTRFYLLTYLSIGSIYSSGTVYLISMKVLWQSIPVIRCTSRKRQIWPLTLTFDLNIDREQLLIIDYIPTTPDASEAKCSWVIRWTRCKGPTWPLPLTYWPEYLKRSTRTIYQPSLKLLRKIDKVFTLTFDPMTWQSIGNIKFEVSG